VEEREKGRRRKWREEEMRDGGKVVVGMDGCMYAKT